MNRSVQMSTSKESFKSFDCLAADCPLFGPHLLEASAGTGKTFAIEHVFVRLLLQGEEPLELNKILAVTFTKAAASELKERIRGNLETILKKEPAWEYLRLFSKDSRQRLENALFEFDRCQIFTIHSFCFRMLREFALEANLCLNLTEPEPEVMPLPILRGLSDFLEGEIHSIEEIKQYKLETFIKTLWPLPKYPKTKLQKAWAAKAKKIIADNELLSPDDLLVKMKEALEKRPFLEKVRAKYQAVIIDEFQDTDPIQWGIFAQAFPPSSLAAFYLVGDPKQSIYRFRNADLYTYLEAKNSFPKTGLYHLDTNFRSTPPLIHALNCLFEREWIHLPKENKRLAYHPVKAGRDETWEVGDNKGAIHFYTKESDIDFIIGEIEALYPKLGRYDAFAILVKDRYEMEEILPLLQKKEIPVLARSRVPIGQTEAFQAWKEFFYALLHPDQARVLLASPFFRTPIDLFQLKEVLEKEGVYSLFRSLDKLDLWTQIAAQKGFFYSDSVQIVESLLTWAKIHPFSPLALQLFLETFERSSPERRMAGGEDAVQIMTMHSSKGLEFDIVFAYGLASKTPDSEEEKEELEAEKLRQLYVTMTRAKKRLYVPLPPKERKENSPIELFFHYLPDGIESLKKIEFVTIGSEKRLFSREKDLQMLSEHNETVPQRELLEAGISVYGPVHKKRISLKPPKTFSVEQPRSSLLSFSALTQEAPFIAKEALREGELPRSAETGVLIHRLFEHLFLRRLWKDKIAIELLVKEELTGGPLALWIEEISELVQSAITTPLDGFTLQDLDEEEILTEVEFLYYRKPDYIKGVIDLVFRYHGKVYFIDWKTNWLKDYTETSLRTEMEEHKYFLQADLYSEALYRRFGKLGGAFYYFVRGKAVFPIYPRDI